MKSTFLYFFVGLSLCFSACKQNTEKGLKPSTSRSILPPSTGNISELVIVVPDNLWQGSTGLELKNIFQANVLGIPQQEALFDVFAINPSQFSSIFKTHKSILWLSLDKTPSVSRKDNHWSKNQLFVSVKAKSETELTNLLIEQGQKISDWFLQKDLARRVAKLKKTAEQEIQKEILEAYNFSMLIPKGYKITLAEENFVWLRRDKPKVNVISNLWVHTIPYTSPSQLSKEYLIQLRDSLGREHVEGARPQSYMTTEMLYEPDFSLVSEKPYTVEMRGLWTMVNDFLGGSFISYTRLDEANQRIIFTEGFLYCPKERKRFYIQELEAVLTSFKTR
jgi:hypothetical protein